jgi:hypothetical protein
VRGPPINRGIYDGAVSGADPIDMPPGFAAMLEIREGEPSRQAESGARAQGGGRWPWQRALPIRPEGSGSRRAGARVARTAAIAAADVEDAGRPVACRAP